jgi:hypothetical protein
MDKILEFNGGHLALKVSAINAVDIDSDDKRTVRIFIPDTYNVHFPSEEMALEAFNEIVKEMKETL